LDLHTELTNEYTFEDDCHRDCANWMIRNRKLFGGEVDGADLTRQLQQQAQPGESLEQTADRVIVSQRENIEEITTLIHKKWEILNGVRRIAQKNREKD
jgi:hypothetical protein